jgi:hypothetical protein
VKIARITQQNMGLVKLECATLLGEYYVATRRPRAGGARSRSVGKKSRFPEEFDKQWPRQTVSMTAPINPTEVIVC